MRVTFVHLGRENLGIEYLSSILEKAGHETFLACDPGLFGFEDNVFYTSFLEKVFSQREKVIDKIEKSAPDLVAFSVYTSTYAWACDIAKITKERLGVKIVFGGVHASLIPESVIEKDFVDFVIEGEGEYALLDLVEVLSLKKTGYDIENLWYKNDGRVARNRLRPPIQNLDLLPLPNKDIFGKYVNYKDDYMIMTGRGCVFNCSYCCESYMNRLYDNKFYRRRSAESVMHELLVMKEKYNYREVMFFDALFFTDKEWLKVFLERYKREIGVPFKCRGKITFFNEEIGRLLKESGCYCLDFGMQTLNESLKIDVLNRRETNQCAERVFKLCDRLKLRYDVDHMFGLPGERLDDYFFGARFYSRLKYINRIKCFELTYFPKMRILASAMDAGLLDEEDIAGIEKGRIGDFYHNSSVKNKAAEKTNRNFKVFYKFLPLVPCSCVRFILKNKIYRVFRFIPAFVVVFLQILVAIRGRDYRYFFYLKYYLLRVRRIIRNGF
ncbi:MAG: cobalamin-dependent protein [Candidatus Omnitrophica bacterium]|nr:cobalamin-dependent protein [Candidatus Omnitrophota bacterium]